MKPSINRLRSDKFLNQTALMAFTNFLNVLKTCLKFLHWDTFRYPDGALVVFYFNRLSFNHNDSTSFELRITWRIESEEYQTSDSFYAKVYRIYLWPFRLHCSRNRWRFQSLNWVWSRFVNKKLTQNTSKCVFRNFFLLFLHSFQNAPQQKRKFHFCHSCSLLIFK